MKKEEEGAGSAGASPGPSARDMVNHPPHYTAHPSGVECIQITEHMGFCIGNAIKYLWRSDEKGAALEDLKKARWYIDREIQRRESMARSAPSPQGEGPSNPYLGMTGKEIQQEVNRRQSAQVEKLFDVPPSPHPREGRP